MSPRRTWIKLWCGNWLRGSIRKERPETRGIFADVLALGGDSAYGEGGTIQIAEDVGFTDEAIAAILNVPSDMWQAAKEILSNHKDPDENRIRIRPLRIGYAIDIINWAGYQSEYERQKPYRKQRKERLQERLQDECVPKRDIEGEGDKEKEKLSLAVPAIVKAWNEFAHRKEIPWISGVKKGSTREKHLIARIGEGFDIDKVLDAIAHQSFLTGDNKDGWLITFDWILNPTNLQKVLEGNYTKIRRGDAARRAPDDPYVGSNRGIR